MSVVPFPIQAHQNTSSLREIAARFTNDHRVLQIDLNEAYTTGQVAQWQGIDLLRWLRVLGVNNHCVLSSNLDLVDLLRMNSENWILTSTGTTYVKHGASMVPSSNEEASPKELRDRFRKEVDLAKVKHEMANIFGLERLQYFHKANDSSFRPAVTARKPDLKYEVFKFAYDSPAFANYNNIGQGPKLLNDLRRLVDKTTPKVVLVDDKANDGWAELFKSILGRNCKFAAIAPKAGATPETLAAEILTKQIDVWNPHLLILDLRLLESEDEATGGTKITDYRELLSYRTIKQLGLRDDDNLRLKILFSTASNDHTKLKRILADRKYSPHGIFVKEGIDQGFTPQQSLDNYLHLLKKLKTIIGKKSADDLLKNGELTHEDVEKRRAKYANQLKEKWKQMRNRSIGENDKLLRFDEVLLDTNIFLQPDLADVVADLLITSSSKIRIPRNVQYELEKIGIDSALEYDEKDVLATFFLDKFTELALTITEMGMSLGDREVIRKNGHHPSDFADRQIFEIAQNCSNPTVLLSKDGTLIEKIKQLRNYRVETSSKPPSREKKGQRRRGGYKR